MKFLADMCISPRCVEWLRLQGYDAIHLIEQGLHKLPDCEVLRKAKYEKRVLLTMDLDFARLMSCINEEDLPIVILFRLSDQRPHNMLSVIGIILPIIQRCVKQGNLILSVSDDKVRIRHLPIDISM